MGTVKVQKYLWYHEITSEILAKQFGPNIRIPSLFSREELEKKWDPMDIENLKHIKPIESTMVWVSDGPEDA